MRYISRKDREKLRKMSDIKDEKVIAATAAVLYLIKTDKATWKNIYVKIEEIRPKLSLGQRVDAVNLAKSFFMTPEILKQIRYEVKEEMRYIEATYGEDIINKYGQKDIK